MDTSTHLVIGVGLSGLAYIDSAVAADPTLASAVMLGTLIGSQAPDFDTFSLLKSPVCYIKNHRGITHSLPFIPLWTAIITGVITFIFPMSIHFVWHVAAWTFLAVALHVLSDCFNTYGTQAARPFSLRWISWNIIHIFDPFIFLSHLVAILLWIFSIIPPAPLFTTLYGLIVLYYAWRIQTYFALLSYVQHLENKTNPGNKYILIPTVSLTRWHVLKSCRDGSFKFGYLYNKKLTWVGHEHPSNHMAAELSKQCKEVQTVMYVSPFVLAKVYPFAHGYKIRWEDVRYRKRKKNPFIAVVIMDKKFNVITSYMGLLRK